MSILQRQWICFWVKIPDGCIGLHPCHCHSLLSPVLTNIQVSSNFPCYKHCCNKHLCTIQNITWKYNTINSGFLKAKPPLRCRSMVTPPRETIISVLRASHWRCEVQLRKCICKFFINCKVYGAVLIVQSSSFTTTLQGKHGGYTLKVHWTDKSGRHKELKAFF